MSILINAIMDHQMPEWNNASKVISILNPALPDLRTVKDYWDKNGYAGKDINDWQRVNSCRSFEAISIQGPGGIHVDIARRALAVGCSGRWSGFMTIPELRKVHLDALRSISISVDASFTAFFADNDDVWDFFYFDLPYQAINEALTKTYGAPRSNLDLVDIKDAQLRPTVWYYETMRVQQ